MREILLCALNALLMAAGQLLFKLGAKGKSMDTLTGIFHVMINPIILLALVIYAASTVLWLYILSKVPLSYAQPISVLAIPTVVVLSMILFNETIPFTRWAGVVIICIGVFIVSIK